MAGGLCLAFGAALVALNAAEADLAWTHSVQKTEWREHWRAVTLSSGAPALQITQASVEGSGAGMEPGEDAKFKDGRWVWAPKLGAQPQLILTRSPFTPGDWKICLKDQPCRPVGDYFPGIGPMEAVTLKVCP